MRCYARQTLLALSAIVVLGCGSAHAQDHVTVSYQLISNNANGGGSQVSLELTISNHGDSDLHRLELVSTDYGLGDSILHPIRVEALPVNGAISVVWSLESLRSNHLFDTGLPLNFIASGKKQAGEIVSIPVISESRFGATAGGV